MSSAAQRETFGQRTIATFRREKTNKTVWQPRLNHWYNVNKARGTLPARYREKSVLDIYEDLGASIRFYQEFRTGEFVRPRTELEGYLRYAYKGGVKIKERRKADTIDLVYETPKGQLIQRRRVGEWGCSEHPIEYPVKNISDLNVLAYVLRNRKIRFDWDTYQQEKETLGERDVIQSRVERTPVQNLLFSYMGVENAVYAFHDYSRKMRDFIRLAEQAQDEIYETLARSPIDIFSIGENIDGTVDAPSVFCEYLVPYYRKRVAQLHEAGKFCHIHMDGRLKALLPFLGELPFDGLEALTPLPQGDVSLEELEEALGSKIVLDGIPAILFLSNFSYQELEKFTLKVLELFSPHIILGISDLLPPEGDIEKVRLVSQIVASFEP